MPWGDFISDCVPGQPVSSARHNSIRDQVAHIVPTKAQLPNDVADGSTAIVADQAHRLHVRRGGRWWSTRTANLAGLTTDANGYITVTAAMVGLVEMTFGQAIAGYTPAPATIAFSALRMSGSGATTALEVRVWRLSGPSPATIQPVASQALTQGVYVYAEGYVT